MSIEVIKGKYGIETDDLTEIRAKLRELLALNHPDNNGGKCDSDKFQEIHDDIEWVEKIIKSQNAGTLVPINEVVTAITEILKVSLPVEANQTNALGKKLEENISQQMEISRKLWRGRKYTSAGILAIITFIWMFPEQIATHPLLTRIWNWDDKYILFITFIWFLALYVCCIIWVYTTQIEKMEKRILERVQLESVQNDIFMSFIHENCESKFEKDEFMKYILFYICRDIRNGRNKRRFREAISEEVIQNIADIILLRAEEQEIIKKVKSKNLIDCYEIIQNN